MPAPRPTVVRCPSGLAAIATLLDPLTAALDGSGPPLALVPADPVESERVVSAVRPEVPVECDGIAAIVTTSGSTGVPKGVLLPGTALRASATATLDRMGGPGQWLLGLPPYYIAGLQVLVRSVLAGSTPVVLDAFSPAAFTTATRRLEPGARHYTALVPTQLGRLLDDPTGRGALAAYDAVLLGGAAAPPHLLARARELTRVLTTYGMSETCGGCVYDGVPLTGITVDVRADGRVRLAGPVLAAGYRLDPDLSAAAFEVDGGHRWHVTPDLGRFVDGVLEVFGRADDVALSGGVNVPLPAVERVVGTHPAIGAAACLSVPDPDWGERVVAYVVPRSAAPSLTDLRDHVASTLPRTWAPREVVVLSELPLLASGKPDRQALRQLRDAGSV